MLTELRKRLLLDHLRKKGRIIAKEMSRNLKLSEDTIRRDLRELAADGKLLRVHGGALPASPTVKSLQSRRSISTKEKEQLGRAGAKIIHENQIVFVDGGTTNLELVKAIPLNLPFELFTHSPSIAAALEHHEAVKVHIIGGVLFRHSMVTIGAVTLEGINNMRFDLCFIGANGWHAEEGLTTGDFEEATIKRAVIDRSAEPVLLLTSDKLGTVSRHRICAVSALSKTVVTASSKLKMPKALASKILRV